MYARTTTVRGSTDNIDAGIAQVRDEVMPAILAMDGCIGLSMLVDREVGTGIVTTAWSSRDAMVASRDRVKALRNRAAQVMDAGEPEVQEWEIAVLHRVHWAGEAACSRVTWLQIDPSLIDRQLEIFRGTVLPRLEEVAGFCSASVLVDRETGRATSAVTYRSKQFMESTRELSRQLRQQATGETGARILDLAEMELAIAHLRVPETV